MKMKFFFAMCFALAATGARGQIYIDSYRFATTSTALLLDSTGGYPGAAAAYSLRKLRTAMGDSCIQVRNATTTRTFVIGFVNNYLDTVRLKDSCATANCFVRIWYDQSGNARHAQQTTDANQPQIVSSGSLMTNESIVNLDFDGTNDRLDIPSSTATFKFLHDGTNSSLFFIGHKDVDQTLVFYGNDGTSQSNIGTSTYTFAVNIFTSVIGRGVSGNRTASVESGIDALANNENTFVFLNYDADNATAANRLTTYIKYNNSSTTINNNTLTNAASTSNASFSMQIGSPGNSILFLNGGMAEIIIWNVDRSSDRSNIETNINNFYSIFTN